MASGLKGQLHDALVLVRGGEVEDGKDVLPARADVCRLRVHHLGYAAHDHVSDGGGPARGADGGGSDESTKQGFSSPHGLISFVILGIISAGAGYIFEAAVAIVKRRTNGSVVMNELQLTITHAHTCTHRATGVALMDTN